MEIWTFGQIKKDIKDDYQEGKAQLSPDAGANFERELFTTTKDIITGQLKMKYAEFLEFQQFYKDTKQGSDTFDYFDCRLGIDRPARFFNNWTAKEVNGYWVINLNLIFDKVKFNIRVGLGFNQCPAGYNQEKAGAKTNYEL